MGTLRFPTRTFLWTIRQHFEVASNGPLAKALERVGDNGVPATNGDARRIARWLRSHANALDRAADKAQKGGA